MLTMKNFLVLIAATTGCAVLDAQAAPAVVQQVAMPAGASQAAAASSKAGGLRQLSAEERAELRRQLYQYSRLSGKGS